jgi:hypothetical protein
MGPDQLACLQERHFVESIEDNNLWILPEKSNKFLVRIVALKGDKVHQCDLLFRLPGKVDAEIALIHGSDGVGSHGWMAVNAIDAVGETRVEVPEKEIAAHLWHANDNGNVGDCEDLLPDFQGSPDAANLRRTVKRGADLVMANRSPEGFQLLENGRKIFRHPLRGPASTFPRDPHRTGSWETSYLIGFGRFEKEHRVEGVNSQRFQGIRRSREIVSIKCDRQAAAWQ